MSEDSQLCSQIDSILARLDRRMEEAKTVSPFKENPSIPDFSSRIPLNSRQNNRASNNEMPLKKPFNYQEQRPKSGAENETAQEKAQKIGETFFNSLGKLLNRQANAEPEQSSGTFKIPEHHRLESFGKETYVQEVKLNEAIQMQSQHQKHPSFGGNKPKLADSYSKSSSKSPLRDKSPLKESSSSFQPQLSKKSMVIAKKLGSAKERLLTQPAREATNNTESLTFKPEINKKSAKIANKLTTPSKQNRWEALYLQGHEQKIKLEKIRKEAEESKKEDKECTFKPSITPTKERPDKSSTIDRLLSWGKVKEQKIKQKRDDDLEKDLEGCTFTPQINDLKYFIEEDISSLRGVSKFLDRQHAARRLKEEKFGPTPIKEELSSEQTSEGVSQYNSTTSKDITMQEFAEAIESLHDELHSFQI
ncbi:unnamed protein product [Blepharisma stoltei]|uniref:Uncharacterized protein n=1 Tax=Blepharisma stoltei TaxID=1481888 RepID=A0AAU9J3B8_9CILI|nr:unnamed protein product [Blepharisma stoltei]